MADAARTPAGERVGGWRLAEQPSAYLRGAAEQPIDWFPWGEEPFELAKRTNRPVLLDVGAVWCHWCHVMDEGTYADAEVARLLRQNFVAVKVDRDERPEVDRRYQRQVSALTGEGGWPLTAFLLPSGEVFLGGTYFPAQDGMGRPGLRRVLKEVARLWKEEPDKIQKIVQAVRDVLGRLQHSESAHAAPSASLVDAVRNSLESTYDPVNGGFGLAPKFPHPTAVAFQLWDSFAAGDERSAARARQTLQRMADGGLYDQVGGGFHRYSVDEGWHIPHFEKMGVDNSALLAAYADGYRRFGDLRFAEVVRGVLGWVLELLTDSRGGFGASQDADNAPGDDGSYFTWSRAELKSVLDPVDAKLVTRFFGVGSEGQMPHDPDRNVLYRLMSVAEAAEGSGLTESDAGHRLDGAVAKLRAARDQRPRPYVDRALYSGLNGAYIRGFVGAYRALHDPIPLATARSAADRFLKDGYTPDQGVAHRLDPGGGMGWGLLDDQAEFALGLVELAGETLEPRYVTAAGALLSLIDREFRGEGGLLRDVAPRLYDGPKIGSVGEPSYPFEDNPQLSATAAAGLAAIRLASLTGEDRWRELAKSILRPAQARLAHAGLFAAGVALGTGLLQTEPARVVVEGKGAPASALVAAARAAWHPNAWVFLGVPPAPFSLPEELTAKSGASDARALICYGTRCLAPVTDPAELGRLVARGAPSAAS